MHPDVLYLRDFYYRQALGKAVQKALNQQVGQLWPSAKRETVLGYGFAVPLLRPFLAEAHRVIAFMPAEQGVMPWPVRMPNVSVLCDEIRWPIETGSVNKLLVLHGLDASEHPGAVLEEAYRVLADNGRAIFIVPNRTSLWARNEGTPFSYTRPYTASQLDRRLMQHGFNCLRYASALYQPPWRKKFWLKAGPFIERIGHGIFTRRTAGALIVEAEKQVPRPERPRAAKIVTIRSPIAKGILVPQPHPKTNDTA